MRMGMFVNWLMAVYLNTMYTQILFDPQKNVKYLINQAMHALNFADFNRIP